MHKQSKKGTNCYLWQFYKEVVFKGQCAFTITVPLFVHQKNTMPLFGRTGLVIYLIDH